MPSAYFHDRTVFGLRRVAAQVVKKIGAHRPNLPSDGIGHIHVWLQLLDLLRNLVQVVGETALLPVAVSDERKEHRVA